MRPTRRNFVALGKTSASACRASSIRGMVVPMPCPTLPAIEPDASNTIMASSLHGGGSGSSERAPWTLTLIITAQMTAANRIERKSRAMLPAVLGWILQAECCHLVIVSEGFGITAPIDYSTQRLLSCFRGHVILQFIKEPAFGRCVAGTFVEN